MVEFSLLTIFEHLLLAARWTVALSCMAFVLGGLVGLALLLARIASRQDRFKPLGYAVTAYVQLFQGTPLLMQLFLAYFGLALLVDSWLSTTAFRVWRCWNGTGDY